MSVPSKHDKERLCTLTSRQGPRAGWDVLFCFVSADFVSDQSELRAFCSKTSLVTQGREFLAEGFPWLPEGGLPSGKPVSPPPGAGWGRSVGRWSLTRKLALPFSLMPKEHWPGSQAELGFGPPSLPTPSVTLGKSLVSLPASVSPLYQTGVETTHPQPAYLTGSL